MSDDRDEDAEYWQMLQDFRGGRPARNAPNDPQQPEQPPQGRRTAGPRRRREVPPEGDLEGYPGQRPGAPTGPGGYSGQGGGSTGPQESYGRRADRNRQQQQQQHQQQQQQQGGGGPGWAEERPTWGGQTGEQPYGRRSGQIPVPPQAPPSTPPQAWSPEPQRPERPERGRGRRRPEEQEQSGQWQSGPMAQQGQPREWRAPGWPEGPPTGPQSGAQALPQTGPQTGPQSGAQPIPGPPSGPPVQPGQAESRSGELRQPDSRRRRADRSTGEWSTQDWTPPESYAPAEAPPVPGTEAPAQADPPQESGRRGDARRGHRTAGEAEPEAKQSRLPAFLQLSAIDREVLGIWLLTRISLLMISITAPWLFAGDRGVPSWLDRWKQWDVLHFDRIATQGYFGHSEPEEAFFPGLPMLMKIFHVIGLPTTITGLLVSFVAGGVAAVALGRLADREWGEGAGRRATMAWMLAPPAVFLAAPYTEALFLGFAIPAWLAARKSNWRLAGLLTAGACAVRVSGLFLMVALAVEFLTSRRRRGTEFSWLQGAWLAVPAVPLLGYMGYLWANTGDALRWYHAQSEGWYREFTMPWDALIRTWQAATGQIQYTNATAAIQANFDWMFRAELVAMLIGVVITVVLCLLARWGEATWIGLQVLAFSTSAWFFSVPRATLLWFPMWIFFGALALRHRLVWWGYLAISAPLFGVWAAAFFTGRWSG